MQKKIQLDFANWKYCYELTLIILPTAVSTLKNQKKKQQYAPYSLD